MIFAKWKLKEIDTFKPETGAQQKEKKKINGEHNSDVLEKFENLIPNWYR